MLWSRKTPDGPTSHKSKLVGVDLNSSRVRALVANGGHTRTIALDSPNDELPLFISLERRSPEVGLAGYALARKLPHLVCSNYLPQLGQAREWRAARGSLTPESALLATFEKMRGPLVAETDRFALVLPPYIAATQLKALRDIASKAKLPIIGTASSVLAVAAHRASMLLAPEKATPAKAKEDRPSWVVPIRSQAGGPGTVVIVDVDEYALTAGIVNIEPKETRLLNLGTWPRFSMKSWKEKLIDGLSDRCVRLCRRDPRDSADAEQSIFEQLDSAMDKVRQAQSVTLTIRAEKWYQDLVQQPTDFDLQCTSLIQASADSLQQLLSNTKMASPPRAVWLTDAAAKLPGLAAAIFQNSSEQTEVAVLPMDAVTEAAAALQARWMTATLPNVHLDGVIALELETRDTTTRSQKKTKV